MSDELLKYYNRELAYLRHMGSEFAERHPKIAGNLKISGEHIEDPHVSRLLEGVALLTAQIRQKLDDSFPELTEALVGKLFPDYHAPIPSSSIIKLTTENMTDNGLTIPSGTKVESIADGYKNCLFKTCYDTKLWPAEISLAKFRGAPFEAPKPAFDAAALSVLKLRLSSNYSDIKLKDIGIDRLRLYLNGQPQLSYELYQLLNQSLVGIALSSVSSLKPITYLSPKHIAPVGFESNQKVVPYGDKSFDGYRLLVEYFVCPEKFLFVDLNELQPDWFGDESEVDIYLYFDRDSEVLVKQLTAQNVLLGCVPIVNTFDTELEPIRLNPAYFEHKLVARNQDTNSSEIISIRHVEAYDQHDSQVDVSPFYGSACHDESSALYWSLRREVTNGSEEGGEQGTDSFLSMVSSTAKPIELDRQERWLVNVSATCSNRNLPSQLPTRKEQLTLLISSYQDLLKTNTRCLKSFSKPVRPKMFESSRWQLVSQLSLNHFANDPDGTMLKTVLQLYDFTHAPQTKVLVESIRKIELRSATARVRQSGRVGICQGNEMVVEFSGRDVSGSQLFFFGQVLAHFLAQYVVVNSFCRLTITLTGAHEPVHCWPAMSGTQELL
ncbi:type VI secretion system baseplate subunit TssF [Vibrio sp. 10N]|uniref:type VI secretion system baseplate subunit TssF n=1 Tax=Vibrio sp. 10N TaxID=3058938 RepID=UPI002812BF8E|nr:type VI secretion system baseplate subunit TssF [Vibrio sp. 10N]